MAFNKMFVMIPVMLAARKLDGEDPNVVFLLRCSYCTVQFLIFLFVAYIYIQSTAISTGAGSDRTIYVPPPPQPFEDANAKKKYTEQKFGAHVATQARQLLVSTFFGVALTLGLHWYKGLIIGLAIQTIMGPLNLLENPLAKCVLMGGGLQGAAEKKIFGEKEREELTSDDEIVDASGNAVVLKKVAKNEKKEKRNFEDILLDTWDAGAEADIGPLMAALNKSNINYRTEESGWTPIMIMSAIGVKQTTSAMRQMKSLGADPAITDGEGWNALHWAAFHGSVDGAKFLVSETGYGGINLGLDEVTDKDGKTALEHAKAEGNDAVAKVISDAISAKSAEGETVKDEGLRKRK
eukprot:CAMPEP_0197436172 /NCGR_PEP_ID=MMETSP1175-20131217/3644_1 /TAXON_ID=1003142 /ORGANISM="Triceratium dubium, Strain CCMP147" /LENGTH=350 /DNA_ID=CAMNT_0042965397 /DNA_START=247 /DNA_END=1299 /DNA_ORIENTATION=+